MSHVKVRCVGGDSCRLCLCAEHYGTSQIGKEARYPDHQCIRKGMFGPMPGDRSLVTRAGWSWFTAYWVEDQVMVIARRARTQRAAVAEVLEVMERYIDPEDTARARKAWARLLA